MAETKHDNLPFGVYFNVWSLYMIQFFYKAPANQYWRTKKGGRGAILKSQALKLPYRRRHATVFMIFVPQGVGIQFVHSFHTFLFL